MLVNVAVHSLVAVVVATSQVTYFWNILVLTECSQGMFMFNQICLTS